MLLYKAAPLKSGYNKIVSPENAPLKHLEFGRLLLEPGQQYDLEADGREKAICLLSGVCQAEVRSSKSEPRIFQLGPRADAFDPSPWCLYSPRQAGVTVTALKGACQLAISFSDAPRDTQPALITPKETKIARPGAANWRRDVYTLLGADVDCCRLLVGETLNLPGNWSSYPPHKHDVLNPPSESPMEEVYFFLVKPPTGFAVQIVYTGDDDPEPFEEVYLLHDGDTVVLPKGYHPVASAPGYTLYYFWALAGEERRYGAWSDDPKHAWLRGAEAIIHSQSSR
jgi:5-deoxy-glucuronate isomerase